MKFKLLSMLAFTLVLLLLSTLYGEGSVQAATFTVNSNDDADDGACNASHCSLREAINAANANRGKDKIAFNIPGTGPHTIQPTAVLPTITDLVIIDGATQPGFLGRQLIELDGSRAGIFVNGLTITAGSSVVRGLVINRFSGSGIVLHRRGGNVVEGSFIGTNVTGTAARGNGRNGVLISGAPSNTIGGTAAGAGNVISANDSDGVQISGSGATGNLVQGNLIGTDVNGTANLGNRLIGVRIHFAPNSTIGGTTAGAANLISGNDSGVLIFDSGATGNLVQGNLIGTDVNGTTDLGNRHFGVSIAGGSNNTIGGTATGAGNVISGNDTEGVEIFGSGATGNLVQGNLIGTDVSGTADLGNGTNGVRIDRAPNNTIGGTAAGAGNVISGNNRRGVLIVSRSATGNLVRGNLIGTQTDGTSALGNALQGVFITGSASNNIIGGTVPGAGNTIAFNPGGGVFVKSGTGNGIFSNSTFSNGSRPTDLGIDLFPHGVTPNDPLDPDPGANTLQNFPVLFSASPPPNRLTLIVISGALNSTPSTDFTLEFFHSRDCDPSRFGEGENFIGSTMVTTDNLGNAPFAVTFSVSLRVTLSGFITSTATDPNNNTSEFSRCLLVRQVFFPVPDIVVRFQFINVVMKPDSLTVVPMQVQNGGGAELTSSLDEDPAVDWLSQMPTSGTVAPGAGQTVEVNFDSAGLAPGTFVTTLNIRSNDRDEPLVQVPVSLEVTLLGPLPQCEVNPLSTVLGAPATVDATSLPPNGIAEVLLGPDLLATGPVDGLGNASIAFTIPSDTATGTRLVTVRAQGTAITADCAINLEAAPDFIVPPTPPLGDTLTVAVGDTLTFDVEAFDRDAGDVVTLDAIGAPLALGATFDSTPGNPATGTFSWTPDAGDVGTHPVTFTAADDQGRSAPPHTIFIEVVANRLGPRDLKEDAIAELEVVKVAILDGAQGVGGLEDAIENIDDAISSVEASLDSFVPGDQLRLTVESGEDFFENEEDAVEDIFDTVDSGEITNLDLVAELRTVIGKLHRADRVIVKVAIDDAVAARGDQDDIDDALEEQAVALEQVTACTLPRFPEIEEPGPGPCDDAVGSFADAWENAQEAVGALDDDDDDDDDEEEEGDGENDDDDDDDD